MAPVGLGGREVGIVERTGFDSGWEMRGFGRGHELRSARLAFAPHTSVCGCGFASLRGNRTVTFRPAIAEELPHFAHFLDHVEIKIRYDDFIFIAAGLRDNLTARIAEITLAIELPDAPRLFYRQRD